MPAPCFLQTPYRCRAGEAASTPVPGDLGMGLARHHTFQIQGLPFGHVGRGGRSRRMGGARPGYSQEEVSELGLCAPSAPAPGCPGVQRLCRQS